MLNQRTYCEICGKNRGDKKYSHVICSKIKQKRGNTIKSKAESKMPKKVVELAAAVDRLTR